MALSVFVRRKALFGVTKLWKRHTYAHMHTCTHVFPLFSITLRERSAPSSSILHKLPFEHNSRGKRTPKINSLFFLMFLCSALSSALLKYKFRTFRRKTRRFFFIFLLQFFSLFSLLFFQNTKKAMPVIVEAR